MRIFGEPDEYAHFLRLVQRAQDRTPVSCLAYCLMPNHFHLVLSPQADGDLSRFMFWLQTTHSKAWHRRNGTNGTGHVYQGRFKSFPICADGHFLRVCRYVERNPLRAALVQRAEDWPWSSLYQRMGHPRPVTLDGWPVDRPAHWLALVNEGQEDVDAVRQAVRRSAPFGPKVWAEDTARRLTIECALRPRGRPRTYDRDPAQP
jgi:putative transposase